MGRPFQAAFLIAVAAATLVTHGVLSAAAEECRPTPGGLAPIGSHWYYRIDRSNQRRCWFMRSSASGMSRTHSLRHREMNLGGTTEEAFRQAEADKGIVARSSSPQESPVGVPDQLSPKQLPVTDAEAQEVLVPHKVTSISYSESRDQKPSLRRGVNTDLAFLFGALATALLVAGGALQVVGRIQQRAGALPLKWRASRPAKENASSDNLPLSEKLETMESKRRKLRERLGRSYILSSETLSPGQLH